jgi:hypothetical protein
MTTQEIREQFALLYETMRESKDVSKMKHFGAAFSQMFDRVAVSDTKLAMATLDLLAAIEYNNYVTVNEAIEEASHFINDDVTITGNSEPSRGARWSMDTAKGFLATRGLPFEEKPYYNWPALWLTMNMIYSDYADVIVELVGEKNADKIGETSYKMAVKKLKDRDRPNFIREYFELDD